MDLSILKSLSLAINLAHNDPSLVTALGDWKDYAWVQTQADSCPSVAPCRVPRQRWDWHRPQWVDFTFGYDARADRILVTLTLSDGDPSDADFVCVTAAFLTAEDVPVRVFHQNWSIGPGETFSRRYAVPADGTWASVQSLALGTKQCRGGSSEDDDTYALVKSRLRQTSEQAF